MRKQSVCDNPVCGLLALVYCPLVTKHLHLNHSTNTSLAFLCQRLKGQLTPILKSHRLL